MPDNFEKINQLEQQLDPLTSFLAELSDPEAEEEEFRSDFFQGLSGRRKKAAFALTLIWGTTIGLHLVSWGIWVISAIAMVIALQGLRIVFAPSPEAAGELSISPLGKERADCQKVSLLVAAKNEEAVIGKLAKMLLNLDYPQDRYDIWIVNDNSSDRTGIILDQLARQHQQLNVIHRGQNATGGKSGALNQVLARTDAEIIGVFDADAVVPEDLLAQVVPKFAPPSIGGVQVRKAIANAADNFWTEGQGAEMALDSYFQNQRIACGGMGELRGNGQFVRRSALVSCGSWNEETITDDLDLTVRLHLDDWEIAVLEHPAVQEEGVKSAIALWHQRSRWAEGGYQRYLDYWRYILSNRLSWPKKLDLLYFFFLQYVLPTAAIPDLLMVVTRHRLPLIAPLTSITFCFAFWGMFVGLRRSKRRDRVNFSQLLLLAWQSLRGIVYMIHWFLIVPSTTARMSVRQKRLKWVKTVHEGTDEENLELGVN